MSKDYRIVFDSNWYEIEYRYPWWPFWFCHKPNLYQHIGASEGYQPIDWSLYKFRSLKDAVNEVENLKNNKRKRKVMKVKNEDHHYAEKILLEHLQKMGFQKSVHNVPLSIIFEWFTDEHGLYVDITPEFYYNGVNWNWQVFWYSDNPVPEKNHYTDGSMMYGDNGEYQTKISAELAAIYYMIEKVKG